MVDFKEVADYFKTEVLQYKEEQKLDRYTILRLKGLATGQHVANKKQEQHAKYSWEAILLTMKLKRITIHQYLCSRTFKDEQHKINTIMVILDNGLNDSVKILEKKQKVSQKAESFELPHIDNETAEYKTKSTGVNKKLVGLL